MYKYIERKAVPTSDHLALAILQDNDDVKETVSFFLQRDKTGFLIQHGKRSILVELDWRNCVIVQGAYPGEICLLPMVPAMVASMENCFHAKAPDEFKHIVRTIFSCDYKESIEVEANPSDYSLVS
jgi:hypothetical protein